MNRILILIALLINSVYLGATRKNYKTIMIEDGPLCFPREDMSNTPRITLQESQPGLLVIQPSFGEQRLSWQYDIHCHFVVDVEKQHWFGLYAVIQNLNFRYDAVNRECIDYVEFGCKNMFLPKRICGMRNTTIRERTAYENAEISCVAPKGEIDVTIHIDKESSAPNKGTADMSIAFTLFEREYPCQESYTKCGKIDECILSDLFGDGIVNCPYLYGHDEWTHEDWFVPLGPNPQIFSSDTEYIISQTSTVNTDVIIVATTVVALTIVLSVTCLLIYRMRRTSLQECPVADVENRDAPLVATPEPSAPPANDGKELPPPYNTVNIV